MAASTARAIPFVPYRFTEIANTLNVEGLRTRARIFNRRGGAKQNVGGKRFPSDIVRRLITRPLYAGRVRMNGKEFPGQHAPLVSDELWERANGLAPISRTRDSG